MSKPPSAYFISSLAAIMCHGCRDGDGAPCSYHRLRANLMAQSIRDLIKETK